MTTQRYYYVEVETAQSAKHPDSACGDVIRWERTTKGTTLLCADGIGSGMPARIAAGMLAGRLFESLRQGFSLRDAFRSTAATSQRWREPGKPFVAFCLARIRTDGMATILTYDAPPRYQIKGIDLVTEGAVTLNQVCNLWDEDLDRLERDSGVTDLSLLLHAANRVNVYLGGAVNESHEHVAFRQTGILTRGQIVPLLAERMRRDGKLVVIQRV